MNIKKRLFALTAALLLCCTGCSATDAPADKTEPNGKAPAENIGAPAADTIKMNLAPASSDAWNACLSAALTGQMRLHNNTELMKLVGAAESGETARYTTTAYWNKLPATCEIEYDGLQYIMTLRSAAENETQELVLHYRKLLKQQDRTGLAVNVILDECIEKNAPIPAAMIGIYWAQDTVDQVDAIYFAK